MNVDGLNRCELAHEIVQTVGCTYCHAPKGGRCWTNPKWPAVGRILPPSASHRARIEDYWKLQRKLQG